MDYFENEKTIYFSKLKEKAIVFNKEDENAGYDIFACFDEDYILLQPHQTKLIPTGIAWASSPKYYLQIEERSSTGSKGIKRSAGIVDSGYRGEIKVAITNANSYPLIFINLTEDEFKNKYKELVKDKVLLYSTKKAIAQGVVHEVINMNVKEIGYDELLNISSNRGVKAFGSTNKD